MKKRYSKYEIGRILHCGLAETYFNSFSHMIHKSCFTERLGLRWYWFGQTEKKQSEKKLLWTLQELPDKKAVLGGCWELFLFFWA